MSPVDSFFNGLLAFFQPLITPDWGQLVGLIPYLLLLIVIVFLGLIARAWFRLLSSQPVPGPKVRKPDLRPKILGHLGVIALGVLTCIGAFIAGSKDPAWTGAQSPLGLVVYVPLLLLGLGLVLGATGNAIRLWERAGRDDIEPDALDDITAAIRRHPGRARRLTLFISGVMLAAAGMLAGTVPGPTPMPMPVAFVPLLLLGLVLAIWAFGSSIAALWPDDTDLDPVPAGSDETALIVLES